MFVPQFMSNVTQKLGSACVYLALGALLVGGLLAACSNPFGGNQPSPTATLSANLPLAHLKWCSKPAMLFRDEGAAPTATKTATATTTTTTTTTASPTSTAATTATAAGGSPTVTPTAATTPTAGPGTPTTISAWSVVTANLGFTVYLPANLPRSACLVSAQATVHDPTFGGSFLIGYLLPDHTSITISEAPLASQSATFACNVSNSSSSQKSNPTSAGTPQATASPTPIPLQLCSGAKNTTNIVLSARRSVEYLQQVFNTLQPNVTWIPVS